ncbi:MAG TPA: hypothetical protein VGA31_01385 [Thermoanaerobaculia bacterium]
MPAPALPPLTEWETFYVIIGSSAAALTGLMFVVIALNAEARRETGPAALRAFATPTIVHFGAVLLLAALLSTPRQTIGSLRACILACAIGGVAYASWVTVQARRQEGYVPVLSDWVWHAGLPVIAYGSLVVAGILIGQSPGTALYVVAAAALLLLYIGIHNAWDSAVWLSTKRQDRQE